jgi:FixJ family two-component response regulator
MSAKPRSDIGSEHSIVYVVEPDPAVRARLRTILRTGTVEVREWESAESFLDSLTLERAACLITEVELPGMSGLRLQQRLREVAPDLPVIVTTKHGDVPTAVRVMRDGAVGFFEKPFRDQDLLDRIQQAIERDAALRKKLRDRSEIQSRMARLTPRESEVMTLVVRGDANKAIAYDLGLSERTVEIHRARVMKKMEADSLPQLVQMVVRVRDQTEST